MTRKNVLSLSILALAILGIILIATLINKPAKPVVGENGQINGTYSLDSIMSLKKPYKCTFSKSEEGSQLAGSLLTNGDDVYGEFRIMTATVKDQFNSFLILKDGDAYIWTSLYPVGYQTRAVGSVSGSSSPTQQAQIIGVKDKLPLQCEPWKGADNSTFDPPNWVTFSKI